MSHFWYNLLYKIGPPYLLFPQEFLPCLLNNPNSSNHMKINLWRSPFENIFGGCAFYEVSETILNLNVIKSMSYIYLNLSFSQWLYFICLKIAKFLTFNFLLVHHSPSSPLFKPLIPNPRWWKVIREDHRALQIVLLNLAEMIFCCYYTSYWFIGYLMPDTIYHHYLHWIYILEDVDRWFRFKMRSFQVEKNN